MIADSTGAYCLDVDGVPIDGVDRARARDIAAMVGAQPTSPHDWLTMQLSNVGIWDIGAARAADSLAEAQQQAFAAARAWQPPARQQPDALAARPDAAFHDDAAAPGPDDGLSLPNSCRDFDELDVMCDVCGAPAGVACAPDCTSG
jgi:hypothetical protein